ncbi:MAG: hypothetical protein KCHDKBKB_00444 [Elusimicrobia bacterium]|nr:hypothetical protein [Elusimicrobiota bacterium]
MNKVKLFGLGGLVLGLSTIALIFIAEICLGAAHLIFKSSRLEVVDKKIIYPKNPELFLKIAVFGESTAWGYGAGRSFSDIIEYELLKHSHREVYLRNFSQPGATFSMNQAEIVKTMIPFFDVFIVCAGHNEIWVPTSDHSRLEVYDYPVDPIDLNYVSGLRSRFENQVKRIYSWRDYLEGKSRLFSLGKQFKAWLKRSSPRSQSSLKPKKPPVTAEMKVIPEEEIRKIPERYSKDISEIKELVTRANKRLLICTMPSHLLWPPLFSMQNDQLTIDQRKNFSNFLASAVQLIKNNEKEAAYKKLQSAKILAPFHAQVNYLSGLLEFHKGDYQKAWTSLIKAKDEDGWPIRVLSGVNQAIRLINDPAVTVVDLETVFCRWAEQQKSMDDLFIDLQHPSFRGHVLMARMLVNFFPLGDSASLISEELESILEGQEGQIAQFRSQLGIDQKRTVEDAQMNLKWLLNLKQFSHDEEKFMDYAKKASDTIGEKVFLTQ